MVLVLAYNVRHTYIYIYVYIYNGIWRSLVARHLGVMEVTGSNPAIPNADGVVGVERW